MKNLTLTQLFCLGSIAFGQLFVGCAGGSKLGNLRDSVALTEGTAPGSELTKPDTSTATRKATEVSAKVSKTPRVSGEVQIQYKYLMKILVTYSLALRPNNQMSSTIMKKIEKLDENYRRCYTAELEKNPELRGTVEFLVTKNRGSDALDIHSPSGKISTPVMVQCLSTELAKIHLSPEIIQEQAQGKIVYTFDNFVAAADQAVAAQ
jgi:hypothetical protein